MNPLKILFIIALLVLTSCKSVKVVSDYDKEANFNNYTSFAFFKPGIDKAQINDLDKK
ncbi:MAG: outer membrane protein assembly factor BamE (lipoprotein component of BamABCDE complex), partial [Saprospiraceae bacterium]